jgi:hypothetical protein
VVEPKLQCAAGNCYAPLDKIGIVRAPQAFLGVRFPPKGHCTPIYCRRNESRWPIEPVHLANIDGAGIGGFWIIYSCINILKYGYYPFV